MLWFLAKAGAFLIFLASAGYAATLLVSQTGGIRFVWGGWIIETEIWVASTVLAVGLISLWLLVHVVRTLFLAPSAAVQAMRENRQKRGLEALGFAISAQAVNDNKQALTHARKAERLLANPQLTGTVMAQALTLSGQTDKARLYYTKLASDKKTAAAGVHGLLQEALLAGDSEAALAQARRAIAMAPRDKKALAIMFDLQVRKNDWRGVHQTLRQQARIRSLKRAEIRRRSALLHAAESLYQHDHGNSAAAIRSALQALDINPGLGAIAAIAAHSLATEGNLRKADKILLSAWRKEPCPEVATAWMKIRPHRTEDTEPTERLSKLLSSNPGHPESRILAAQASASERCWITARSMLRTLPEEHPDIRVCGIMAAIEKNGNQNPVAAQAWISRAVNAPRGWSWSCSHCHTPQEQWLPLCPECNAFGFVAYQPFPHEIRPALQDHDTQPATAETARLSSYASSDATEDTAASTTDAGHEPETLRPEPDEEDDRETTKQTYPTVAY